VPEELEITLASEPGSVARARQVTAQVVGGIDDRTLEDITLIVSELVTNAIKHGPAGKVTMRLSREGNTIRGEVEDEGTRPFGRRLTQRLGPGGGHGLRVVDTLSDRWGVDADSARVWFELTDRTS
jgi:anti-sigma regulatory factor (Ser/Thr protein kinase)